MPDATLEDFGQLVGHVVMGRSPIMPQPTWGQDAAYLAFVVDAYDARMKEAEALLRRWLATSTSRDGFDLRKETREFL